MHITNVGGDVHVARHVDSVTGRDRERIRAATELDNWARAEAMPSDAEPELHPPSTRTSHRSLLADLANLRAHNERLRHQNTKPFQRHAQQVISADPRQHAAVTG